MKAILRIVVLLASIPVAWLAAVLVEPITYNPLGSGGYEATPATVIFVPTLMAMTFALCAIPGNVALNAYFRSRGLPKR